MVKDNEYVVSNIKKINLGLIQRIEKKVNIFKERISSQQYANKAIQSVHVISPVSLSLEFQPFPKPNLSANPHYALPNSIQGLRTDH